ncbi:OmpA family protein [Aggregatimonas sangjinii]|uniref:OmpA family protein n=1 Tax=Aggregatimonas sangjinii TaxID=2583587 RepID=A0A5B7SRK0_9FLAO|nr:OmpA family protein [Aggregatimonas sangjinii]QCW99652.1 OmpA family protein [Aggregatimonas sangjinii]
MRNIAPFLGILICLVCAPGYAQDEQLTKKDSMVVSSYMFGLGFNMVDDSGDLLDGFFEVEEEWNYVAFPSRVSIGKYFRSGVGVEAIGTYNRYKVGKTIDGSVQTEKTDYYAFDTRVSYDLDRLVGKSGWFDPYIGVGLGYTRANNASRGTYNGVVGVRTWLSDHWGLDVNASGKWSMGDKVISNHLQYGLGVLYQFDIEKGLSKKGADKLARIVAQEQEKQRVQDSITTVNRLKEEALVAERLAEEKERERLAALEKAELDKENSRKSQLENSIKELGFVYFDLNSSYLNTDSKAVLNALAIILETEQEVSLKITSHTDSRGASTYNQWLSERRVKRTIDYLVSKGISAERLTAEGLGETNLLNECDDTTYCSEEKHKINRRSEFVITKM